MAVRGGRRPPRADPPAPRPLTEAYARRGELVRPASIDLEKDRNFWRVVRADYEDDEAVWLPEAAE